MAAVYGLFFLFIALFLTKLFLTGAVYLHYIIILQIPTYICYYFLFVCLRFKHLDIIAERQNQLSKFVSRP